MGAEGSWRGAKRKEFSEACHRAATVASFGHRIASARIEAFNNIVCRCARERRPAAPDFQAEQTAKKIIGEILERATGEALHTQKAHEWLDHWVAGKKQSKAAKTSERYEQVIRESAYALDACISVTPPLKSGTIA